MFYPLACSAYRCLVRCRVSSSGSGVRYLLAAAPLSFVFFCFAQELQASGCALFVSGSSFDHRASFFYAQELQASG